MMLELPDGIVWSVDPAKGRIVMQHPEEWLWLWRKLGPIISFLEIGSHDGTGLLALVKAGVILPGGRIVSIDYGNAGGPGASLLDAINYLAGYAQDLPVTRSRDEVRPTVGGFGLRQFLERHRSQQHAITFDYGQIGSDDDFCFAK